MTKTTQIIWDHNSDEPGWYARYNDTDNSEINNHDEFLDSEDPEEDNSTLEVLTTIAAPKGMTDDGGNILGDITFHR